MKNYKIYLDVCCLNRPFDNQTQDRVFLESEAILSILSRCEKETSWTLMTSDVIDYELSRLTDISKFEKISNLCSIKNERIVSSTKTKTSARKYQEYGVKLLDSYHLALCETHSVDILLTTDDAFIRAATKMQLNTKVLNPVIWLMEVMNNEQ